MPGNVGSGTGDVGAGGIRRLGAGDREACLRLDRDALGGLWSSEQWRRELEDPRRLVLGHPEPPAPELCSDATHDATADPVAVACGWLVADELHITFLAVAPQQRRRGIGRRLLRELLGEAARAGARWATLEVARGNGPARGLYRACGFREAGVRRAYYRSGDDAVVLWLTLRTYGYPPSQSSSDGDLVGMSE
jgi:ribosomal-protein-alanine N-acetyltransferase